MRSIFTALTILLCVATAVPSAASSTGELVTCLKKAIVEKSTPAAIRERLLSWARAARESTGNYFRKGAARPSHFFLRERKQGLSQTALGWTASFLANPVATAFDRPRALRIPFSMIGYTVFVSAPIAGAELFMQNDLETEAEGVVQRGNIPGAAYIWGLGSSGSIASGEASKLILGHRQLLNSWIAHSGERLPRISDLLSAGLVASSESAALDSLMRGAYSVALSDAGKEGRKFPDVLDEGFRKALAEDPVFGKKSEDERELVSTAFWPRVELKKHSDIELFHEILLGTDRRLDPVGKLLFADEITRGDALAMAAEALDDPGSLEKKEAKAHGILPGGKLSTARRPDIPRFSGASDLSELGLPKLADELDRWRVLMKDPRFLELREAWVGGKLDDVKTLSALQAQLDGLAELVDADRKAGPGPMDQKTVASLFGLNDESRTNPILGEAKAYLASLEKSGSKVDLGCLSGIAELTRAAAKRENDLVRKGVTEAEFAEFRSRESSALSERSTQILKGCADSH